MVTLSFKWKLARATAKLRRWVRQVDAATMADVKAYGAETVKAMVKVTPPGGGRTKKETGDGATKMVSLSVAQSLRRLRERIRMDLEGGGLVPFTDEHVEWHRDKQKRLYAVINWTDEDGTQRTSRASAFRVYQGRVTPQKLAALGAGEFTVQHVTDVRAWIKSHPRNYRMQKVHGTYRMRWYGTRHVASMTAVKAEVRRRQKNVGKLMAGWKPMAAKAAAKLPAAVQRQQGKGSATIRKDRTHRAVLNARNSGGYDGLQEIVDRQLKNIRPRLKRLAKKRAKELGRKLK